ncbi:phage regulatory CII family protein, partial [Marinomonas arenicola]|uniref:phage regulatory CII family protein n=1 Tax=Marinomonas arenicola TaxID=569601 RepID=UPI00311E24B3
MSHLNQAMHDLVHKSAMSAKVISEALGIGRQVLTNKVNTENNYNKLSVHELHAIQILTGND